MAWLLYPSNFHPLISIFHTLSWVQSISSSLWPSLTAVFPILLPNQSCHLCALLFSWAAKSSCEKLNNHADWLCYKFMISHVRWTQSSSVALLLNSTWLVFPFQTAAAPTHPPQDSTHIFKALTPYTSSHPPENIQVISCEPHLFLPQYHHTYLNLYSSAPNYASQKNLDYFLHLILIVFLLDLVKTLQLSPSCPASNFLST